MNEKHRRLMENLKAAKPPLPPEFENWAESEKGKRVLAEILATETAPKKVRKAGRPWSTRGLAWGALVIVVIGVAAFVAVYFLAGSGEENIASQPTTTSPVTTATSSVTIERALTEIISLVEATPTIHIGSQGGGSEEKTVLGEAQVWGIVRSSEVAGLRLDHPATRRQFALWLWRCFGRVLPQGKETATVSDLGSLSAEEQQAVTGLVRDGVIQLPDNRVFHGDEALTPAEAASLLARVKALL